MSLQIIKSGVSDSVQDCGRYGYQHLGINPGGAMDVFSAQLSNALLGKKTDGPVIEIHFPASHFLFGIETIICIVGADFSPEINEQRIPVRQPVVVNKNSVLKFTKVADGARCYLSVLHEFDLNKWLNSYSTNLKAKAGGFQGRSLQKGDMLNYKNADDYKKLLAGKDLYLLPWGTAGKNKASDNIRLITGSEYDWLNDDSKNILSTTAFSISGNSDRMGFRLSGTALIQREDRQLVSSPVTFGTIQLLPDGQLIVLMADHQTTGGYPQIGTVISVDLSLLAQKKPGDKISFSLIDNRIAEDELIDQQNYLKHLQTACKFKIENLLNVTL